MGLEQTERTKEGEGNPDTKFQYVAPSEEWFI